jgi:DNA-binding NarL/FixJ family response regulator
MKTKTLIIDDHQLFSEGLCLILNESESFEVVGQVFDSRQAVYECHKLQPQLVLIDYNMPHKDGLEVVKELKKNNMQCKIVTISMYADSKEIGLFKDAGVDGYLSKTTASARLLEHLTEIMNGNSIFESLQNKVTAPLAAKDNFALKIQLTKREIEILRELKKGLTTEMVAKALNLSFHTVTTHRKNINQKLQIKTQKDFYKFLDSSDLNN